MCFYVFVGQVMGFSAEQVSGFVAMIGILSMIAQVSFVMSFFSRIKFVPCKLFAQWLKQWRWEYWV